MTTTRQMNNNYENESSYDAIIEEYTSYNDYLDSQISDTDMYFLDDIDTARMLVQLGIRGNAEIIQKEEFEQRKKAADALRQARLNQNYKTLSSLNLNLNDNPFLYALQYREEAVRNGKLSVIIFLRDINKKGQEISGYIDYGHRLELGDMDAIFQNKKKLIPKSTDLSFYNWNTQTSHSNSSQNFQVISDFEKGLLFKNKRDRKIINVDPNGKIGDNSIRTEIESPDYIQIVLYDHVIRRNI